MIGSKTLGQLFISVIAILVHLICRNTIQFKATIIIIITLVKNHKNLYICTLKMKSLINVIFSSLFMGLSVCISASRSGHLIGQCTHVTASPRQLLCIIGLPTH